MTCGLRSIRGNARFARSAGLYLRNNSAGQRIVTCTLVDAGPQMNAPSQLTQRITLAPNQEPTLTLWTMQDNGGLAYRYPAFSCMLPPGTGVSGVTRTFAEDVGL